MSNDGLPWIYRSPTLRVLPNRDEDGVPDYAEVKNGFTGEWEPYYHDLSDTVPADDLVSAALAVCGDG